ncbi:MAG: hypothetical protein ACREH4_04655 [Vitreimonas sp.]
MQQSFAFAFVVALALLYGGAPATIATASADDAMRSPACQEVASGVDEVVYVSDGREAPLTRQAPGVRATHPVFGMGDMAIFAVLDGPTSAVRSTAPRPTFRIALAEGGLQPEYKFVLAALAVRPEGVREILVGRGRVNTPTDLPMDRRLRTTQVRAADQTRAPNGYVIYDVTPQTSLAPGEYAFVIYNRESAAPRGRNIADRFYDFGVDRGN